MKITVEFPFVVQREGPAAVARLARAVEAIGFDEIDLFDHVVMGHPLPDRPGGPYPSDMPLLEAFVTLGYMAAVTERVGLGTEVLVLPQRQAALVAKQASTLDLLSGGRVRLGVGVGWQEAEYEALGAPFHRRGRVMDEAIPLLRRYWTEASVDFEGVHHHARAMAMEPKPPQGAIPIWVGGASEAALRRVGRLGDGWLGSELQWDWEGAAATIAKIRGYAEEAGRDPASLGFQTQINPPPRTDDPAGRGFWTNPVEVGAVAAAAQTAGFGWVAVNATGVYVAGARTADALAEALAGIHERIRAETE